MFGMGRKKKENNDVVMGNQFIDPNNPISGNQFYQNPEPPPIQPNQNFQQPNQYQPQYHPPKITKNKMGVVVGIIIEDNVYKYLVESTEALDFGQVQMIQ